MHTGLISVTNPKSFHPTLLFSTVLLVVYFQKVHLICLLLDIIIIIY